MLPLALLKDDLLGSQWHHAEAGFTFSLERGQCRRIELHEQEPSTIVQHGDFWMMLLKEPPVLNDDVELIARRIERSLRHRSAASRTLNRLPIDTIVFRKNKHVMTEAGPRRARPKWRRVGGRHSAC